MARQDWTRDELILALELYLDEPKARGSKTHPAVHALSDTLNNLPIHPREVREKMFRNPNGVGMKLSNFLRFDPNYTGKGLARGNKLEEEVWNEFANDRARLQEVADAIRSCVGHEELTPEEAEGIEEAEEGKLLTRLHKVRERSGKLIAAKKAAVLKATGKLGCEACGFDFAERYGKLGEGFAECHHLKPLSELRAGAVTRLDDLAIVCANCHRMLHRTRPWMPLEALRLSLVAP